MNEVSPLFVAALTGFISGFALSIPVGPINLTIMNEGARCGFKAAGLISLGAITMELIYCAIAFTGFASFFTKGMVKAVMELLSFVFMLYLGIKFLLAKQIPAATKIEARIEQRLHPHSAFMIGFIRTLGNPGVLVGWIILAAAFISRDWVHPDGPGKAACIAGVAAGTGIWFASLSWFSGRGHGRWSEKTLLRMEHVSGFILLGLASAHGLHILWQLARERI